MRCSSIVETADAHSRRGDPPVLARKRARSPAPRPSVRAAQETWKRPRRIVECGSRSRRRQWSPRCTTPRRHRPSSRALFRGGRTPRLHTSRSAFERADAKMERARALTDLGAMLRRRNRRTEARELLSDALDAAQRAGARPSPNTPRPSSAPPARGPRRAVLTGLDLLTASERRVADPSLMRKTGGHHGANAPPTSPPSLEKLTPEPHAAHSKGDV
jgi:Tetratricopeptide repeat